MPEKTILIQVNEGEEALLPELIKVNQNAFPSYRIIVGIIKR